MKKENSIKNQPIGVFDSGIGGLTVFSEIEKLLPQENIIYFGDTARVPYGNKSRSTIRNFSVENILFLLEKKVKMVVVACNTSSALALDYLQNIFRIPIIGVIKAGANRALEVTSGKIGIIGTKSTIGSGVYQDIIKQRKEKKKIVSKCCPLFVPLIEEGMISGKITEKIIEMYLADFKRSQADTLILGCTHYPLLKKEISKYLGGVNIIDSAKEVANHTKRILTHFSLTRQKKAKGKKSFYISDDPASFMKLAKLFLKRNISKPKVINA